ncbi:metallophosphoesterase [Psychrobacter sp. NZS113]|uniref:metallophosphoesterase n=1 Tax=Psychrobacter sp. NZS113 TaxID=2792045 RepID=UPI0018CE272A|nr:metallophosphoesterase [Psychrobacter sp. NZS113]MBH0097008.1 metallophosphoesterase [Psychrobacter sp. NZS113]
MPSNTISRISTPDEQVNILQVTDLHLLTPSAFITDNDNIDSDEAVIYQHSFEKVLQQALNEDIRCDLIIVTGDLVNKIIPTIYDHIFKVLQATEIPFACIAGNHDVTDEVGCHLPFLQRTLVAQPADSRLLNQHIIETEHWQLLLLDSSISGEVAGEITPADMDWLCERLDACDKPTLLALHHHVVPVGSAWIDAHMVENSEDFWQHMRAFEQLKVIISGHIHQDQVRYRQGVSVYTTPSTCYQFMPNEDNFAYDEDARPGYRWLQLANNGTVASWVERLDT